MVLPSGQGEPYRILRKVYNSHADGILPIIPEKTVLVLSSNGTEGHPKEENSKPASAHILEKRLSFNLVPDLDILKEEKIHGKNLLSQAQLVFVGGKGLQSKENFKKLEQLADAAGAVVGCTRQAALNGWADFSKVVGVSGVSLKARVCITFGVSGAGPFLYGCGGVKKLIAINTDMDAPIFRYADEGVAEDCIKVIEEMELWFRQRRQENGL